MMRKMIAALQVSLDGFTQGSDQGGTDWVESWADALALLPDVDAFVQGSHMYPGYAVYWESIYDDPSRVAPFQDRLPYDREVAYAKRAFETPHYVLSSTLDAVSWPPGAQIVRNLDDLRQLKLRPGKNLYVVGGPTLVTGLLNAGLLDELKLIVHPLLLGGGKPLFAGVTQQRSLELIDTQQAPGGKIIASYRVPRSPE